jgi:hypothetical protein
MFKGMLNKRMLNRTARLLKLCEFACPEPGGITIQPQVRSLGLREMLDMIAALDESAMSNLKYLAFDFSQVEEFTGPWGVHFAMLINLSRRLKCRVLATSLHGQPAKVARLFRQSQDIRALCFSLDEDGSPQVAAIAFRGD